MKLGILDYIRAAFNARPIGMWIPPNWIGLGVFGMLGLVNPGFWVLGLGVELAYLYALAQNPRFQRVVTGSRLAETRKVWQEKLQRLILQLGPADQQRYRALERRCQVILEQQQQTGNESLDLKSQGEGLGRLLWIYLRLLSTRQAIARVLNESAIGEGDPKSVEARIKSLETRVKSPGIGEELRKSLSGQMEILQQRMEKQKEARAKLAFLEAELTRIQEQAELIREQAVLATDPEVVSQHIDQISATLGGTTKWIHEQQQIYGTVEDLLTEPPPVTLKAAANESQ
jgi:hypothetical protein